MVQVQEFRIGTRYGFEILHQRGKRVKTKSHLLCKCLLECKDKILVFTNFTSLVLISTMIALLVILFIIKLYARNNTFKSHKVLEADSYVSRSYRGKASRGGLFAPPPLPPPILNRVKDTHRKKGPSNKMPVLAKGINMDICVIGKLHQLFVKGLLHKQRYSKNI